MTTIPTIVLAGQSLEEKARLLAQLEGENIHVTSVHADSFEDLALALSGPPPALVVADAARPPLSDPRTLAMMRETAPLTPLLVVSGPIGEEAVAELLTRGAWGYLGVDRTERLPGAVRLGLAEFTERCRRKQGEDLRGQSQKMEAMGRLAGGVAHDINNLLTAILGYAELLQEVPAAPDVVRQYAGEVGMAAKSAAGLTGQLLAFSRLQVLSPHILNLNTLIRRVESMLRRLIPENIELVLVLDPKLGRVRVDPGQIEQVVINLSLNARDAMPEGGRLTLSTRNGLGAESDLGGRTAVLSVSDTGIGMSEKVRAHLFEPFFTTKESGKGTGLGLSTVYGIVRQSGGSVTVQSEPGKGSTFHVHLLQSAEEETRGPDHDVRPGSLHGKGTILLAEDSDVVRHLASEILRRQGYDVIEAAGGPAALEIFQSRPESFQLLITDIIMPEMSGRDLALRLKKLRPALKVLYLTGHIDTAVVEQAKSDPGCSFLPKPFTPRTLLSTVLSLLPLPEGPASHG